MGHPADKRWCSPGMFRLVWLLLAFCLVGYSVRRQLFWHLSGRASCPWCECDCSSKAILPLPVDCAKDNPEMNQEMTKDIITLLTEEISLHKSVSGDNLAHTKELVMDARKTSLQYQKEAEKCNTGMETCEEAREKAEASLSEESKLSALWEKRARDNGWMNE
ncbi:Mast/stem cell growth factor receptor Kit like [Heracleum sosnowskyi]|uniref:Mast/stem cell growth factor receptor Kit like n=1 Tax=Heracleum sosnowskyi TaxID=360622 RepID=A0AAD8N4R8_9APIA|nr:Mast/stem cell growth factor receptor Kit like [Heracleum sosnowskyi]